MGQRTGTEFGTDTDILIQYHKAGHFAFANAYLYIVITLTQDLVTMLFGPRYDGV